VYDRRYNSEVELHSRVFVRLNCCPSRDVDHVERYGLQGRRDTDHFEPYELQGRRYNDELELHRLSLQRRSRHFERNAFLSLRRKLTGSENAVLRSAAALDVHLSWRDDWPTI